MRHETYYRSLMPQGYCSLVFLLCNRSVDLLTKFLYLVNGQVPPWMKLPAFYLLDAISKNVYEPYARVFASFVIPLFLDTYSMVDDGTRSKMDEMLLTWRTGAPNGKELFGLGPQMAIERGIWGDQAVGISDAVCFLLSSYLSQGPGQITKTQVMSELNFALQAKERAIQANPNDIATKHHIQVLLQVRILRVYIFTTRLNCRQVAKLSRSGRIPRGINADPHPTPWNDSFIGCSTASPFPIPMVCSTASITGP